MHDSAAEPSSPAPAGRPSPHPNVTVVMPALEEARHLREAVDSVFAQDYRGRLDLVVAVGPSRDGTRELADELAREHDGHMTVVDNPTGRTPAGLNLAIAEVDAESSVVVRTDAHASLPPDYVRTAVEVLRSTGAANVGGMMVPAGTTDFEQAVARAMSSKIGIGSAPFHNGKGAEEADTVYLGVFTRDILRRTEGFDEYFVRAQDWELNYRIRRLGEKIWFDPRLKVTYRPRSDLRRLATQFRGSGRWRWEIVRRYPETANARYLLPPLATASVGTALLTLAVNAVTRRHRLVTGLAASVPVLFVLGEAGAAAATREGLPQRAFAWYPAVLATIHLSWGAGFLGGVATDLRTRLRGGTA